MSPEYCVTSTISILLSTPQQSLSSKPKVVSFCSYVSFLSQAHSGIPHLTAPLLFGILPPRLQFPAASSVLKCELCLLSRVGPPCSVSIQLATVQAGSYPQQRFKAIVGLISHFSFHSKVYSLVQPVTQCLKKVSFICFRFYVAYGIRANPTVRSRRCPPPGT